ncbi:class I SAM-dependent methyltransferase [Candidatus Halobonum tyrrellensis]|uniref:Methyltransferase family protein n=1 Tax=Candidatus Halobonum tyrrellensis G22 TaxID=1324957 RepID=V4HGJ8_9EURY|nr:methyltransferase domain-containing protein [Candidatus Halobonum tyrrellensis]ESP86929.1 methyltransferase family protein [Candidatus Halobonum tyrrellensis G22]
MRDDVLDRWVEQPPVGPNIQYLRDAERAAALDRLEGGGRVLDVASEANVTRGVDAREVVRVDFSPAAADRAAGTLGDAVDRYEAIDPDDPALPFDDGAFDAAVSVGPYDWRFLDVAGLTAEVGRVLDSGGRFVLTLPTTRSPYAVTGRDRCRYFDPAAAADLLSPGWELAGADQLFQYPYPLHHLINTLPDRLQEPFVAWAERASDYCSRADAWSLASYLVVDARPLPYADSLDAALDALFRPAERDGFWDEREGTFARGLEYDVRGDGTDPTALDLAWSRDGGVEWRYGPFALMGAVQWRTSTLGSDAYDARLRECLDFFAARLADGTVDSEMPSYGVGPLVDAFARAGGHDAFADGRLDTARELAGLAAETVEFDHAEDALVLYGWATLYDCDPRATPDGDLRTRVDDALFAVADRLTPEGFLAFDNHTTRRHQNQMYALWGLCRAVEATGADGYLDVAETVLDTTLDRRMRPDGAFLWEDVPRRARLKGEAATALGYWPEYWEYLFECHQTFFVNAVAAYYAAGGEGRYDQAVGRAMAWVYGDNPLETDLVAASGIGVPLRQTTLDGRVGAPDQSFKGAYEVGSWVMALTALLDPAGPFDPTPAVHASRDEGSRARDAWLPRGPVDRLVDLLG